MALVRYRAPDDNDRTQFLDEAAELAGRGRHVCLLPQGRFPWSDAPDRAAADRAAIEAEVGRLHAGLDLLAARSVDRRGLALVGHDFGGMLAAVAAPDVAASGRSCIIAATPRWGDWFLPFWAIADDRIDYLRALRPLDPIERIGEVGDGRVLFQFGRRDFFIAPMTGLEFHAAAPAGSELLSYDAGHAMRRPGSAPTAARSCVGTLDLAPTRVTAPGQRQRSVPAAGSAVSRIARSSHALVRLDAQHDRGPSRASIATMRVGPDGSRKNVRAGGREQGMRERPRSARGRRSSAPLVDAALAGSLAATPSRSR